MAKNRRVRRQKADKPRSREKKSGYMIRFFDFNLLTVLIFLICFGLVMLYSTTAYSALIEHEDSMFYFKRQLFFYAAGFAGMYIIAKIDYHIYIKWAKKIYFLSIFMMALVQTPLGKEVKGARRWIRLPLGQQLQPSEIAKIAVILFIPVLICNMGKEIKSWSGIRKALLWGGFSAVCVLVLTDNLSTAIIVMGITCIMIFVVHPKTKPFVILAAAGLVCVIAGVRLLGNMLETSKNFRLRRILVWLNPEGHAEDGEIGRAHV